MKLDESMIKSAEEETKKQLNLMLMKLSMFKNLDNIEINSKIISRAPDGLEKLRKFMHRPIKKF